MNLDLSNGLVVSNDASAGANGRGRMKHRLSAKARASLLLQGCYMGYMRQPNPREKAL